MRFFSSIATFFRGLDQRFYAKLFLLALLLPNFVLALSPYLTLTGALVNLLLPGAIYLLLIALVRKPGRIVLWGIPLLLLNAFQLVLLTIFEGSMVAVDMLLNLFTSNSDEAGELLSGIILPILVVLTIYTIVVILAVRSVRHPSCLGITYRRKAIGLAGASFSIGVALSLYTGNRVEGYKVRNEVYPLGVFYNMYVAGQKLREVANYEQTSSLFDYQGTATHTNPGAEVYVFVLGETSRAYSWGVYGYERATTPNLERRRGELALFRDVITQSNTTYKSVPILLSPADAAHADDLPRVRGIMEAFRSAGFYTLYISNQPENRSFVDFFAMQADEHHRIKEEINRDVPLLERKPIYDMDMLPYLDRALAAGHRRLFVVLHTYGAHYSYKDRYPREARYFDDDEAERASVRERFRLTNGYDNAIRQTDALLDGIMLRLEERAEVASALFYISDHGEDIYDDHRERILHSSPSLSYYQLHVPALFWASPHYRELYPEALVTAQANERKPLSSNITFHTLLDMAGVATPYRVDSLSVLRPNLDVGERVYLNDRHECVPLGALGLTEEDKAVWEKMGLAPFWQSEARE